MPLHPLVGRGVVPLASGQQAAVAVAAAEVADDRVGLPDDLALIADRRDPAVGIERPVGRRVQAAEGAADVVADMGQRELADRPHHRQDVAGVAPSPDLEHRGSLPGGGRRSALRAAAGDGLLASESVSRSRPRKNAHGNHWRFPAQLEHLGHSATGAQAASTSDQIRSHFSGEDGASNWWSPSIAWVWFRNRVST